MKVANHKVNLTKLGFLAFAALALPLSAQTAKAVKAASCPRWMRTRLDLAELSSRVLRQVAIERA